MSALRVQDGDVCFRVTWSQRITDKQSSHTVCSHLLNHLPPDNEPHPHDTWTPPPDRITSTIQELKTVATSIYLASVLHHLVRARFESYKHEYLTFNHNWIFKGRLWAPEGNGGLSVHHFELLWDGLSWHVVTHIHGLQKINPTDSANPLVFYLAPSSGLVYDEIPAERWHSLQPTLVPCYTLLTRQTNMVNTLHGKH